MLEPLQGALTVALTFALVYGLPGRLLVDLLLPDSLPHERFPFALALGLIVVNLTAILAVGLLGLLAPVYLVAPVLGVVAALVTALLLGLRLRVRGAHFGGWARWPTRTEVGLLALTAFATLFFLVHYDKDVFWEESCMVRASSAVHADLLDTELLELHTGGAGLSRYQRDPQGGRWEGTNNFLTYNQGEPLGPTILLAPLVALFGQLAYRLLYVLPVLLLPWAGFLLGRRLFPRPGWASWALALLLTFSPYALEVRTYDENLLASAFGTVALVLLTRPRLPVVAAALVVSAYVGLRQPLVLLVPFLLAWLARGAPRPRRDVALFAGTLALAWLPFVIKHTLFVQLHGGTLFEGAFERPQAPHSLFGWTFELPVLLGWPFLPEPARVPYLAYPTLLAFPLDLLHRFGYGLAALVPAGLAWLFRADRRVAWLLLAWTGVLLALVMVQSNWVEPNKMGVPATALAPMAAAVVAGLVALADGRRPLWRRGAWLVVGLALPAGFVAAVRDHEAPRDERVFGYPSELYDKIYGPGVVRVLGEDPAYVAWDRERLQPRPWPELALEGWHPALIGRSVARLVDALAHPGFEHYDRSLPDELMQGALGEGAVVGPIRLLRRLRGGPPPSGRVLPLAPAPAQATLPLVLDLGAPLVGPPPLRHGVADGPQLTPGGPEPAVVTGLRVPWADHELSLLAARDEYGVVFLFLMPGRAAAGHGAPRFDLGGRDAPRIGLRLAPGDRVRVIDVRVLRPARWYSRWFVVDEGGVWASPPRAVSPS